MDSEYTDPFHIEEKTEGKKTDKNIEKSPGAEEQIAAMEDRADIDTLTVSSNSLNY